MSCLFDCEYENTPRKLYEDGYGRIQYRRRKVRVHRLAWELHHGPIAPGAVIRHTCDNPPCCNVAHLRSGTQQENMRDRDRRGRQRYGPNAPSRTHEAPKTARLCIAIGGAV